MLTEQAIPNPFGITVLGTSIIRIEPDIASIRFSVSRLKEHPKDAFGEVREAARGVQSYLTQAGIAEVGTSRVSLEPSFQYKDGTQQFVGYTASVSFHVMMRDLNRMEEILSGVVDAGVEGIQAVEFETSRLKEIRAEVRKRALATAREKAEIYCTAAGVRLGTVLHIEDTNPDRLRRREGIHVAPESPPEDKETLQAFDPASIVVGAAVLVAYQIQP